MAPQAFLLIVHMLAGSAALTAALVATLSKVWDLEHRWHVYSGRVFCVVRRTLWHDMPRPYVLSYK